jgi:hypothetical protein
MELIGLPDFHAPPTDEASGVRAYWPFGGGSRCFVMPDALTLGSRLDGLADFRLELIRPAIPGLPPVPHAVLELSVATASSSAARVLAALRLQNPAASVELLAPSGGSFRFVAGSSDAPAALLEPIALVPSGLGSLRLVRLLPLDAALLLREALTQGTSPLTAVAEFDYVGVAPRLAYRVRFDPVALLTGLGAAGDAAVTLARDDVVARLRIDRDLLGLVIAGDMTALATESVAAELAEALSDLIRLRYGSASRAREPAARPGFALPALKDVPHGAVEWDLAAPTLATRTTILRLDAFAALGTAAKQQGISSLVVETTIPPMALGTVQLDVAANLPARRVGVSAIGADVIAQPRPPVRPDAVVRTALFSAPADKARLTLRLAPGETPSFTARPFVWRESPTGPQRLDGPARAFAGNTLTLGVTDFPVEFVPVEASDDLLAVAKVDATCHWEGCTQPLRVQLCRGAPSAAFALPSDTVGALIEIAATALDGAGKAVVLPPTAARPMRLSLASFPEFGSHRVTISMAVDPGASLAVVDLLPEALPDAAGNISTLVFTPARPTRDWNWFAPSPFAAGYRWRRHIDTGTPVPWSDVQSPFIPLNVSARELTEAAP